MIGRDIDVTQVRPSRPTPEDVAAMNEAADQTVLRRAKAEGWSEAEVHQVQEMLGLRPYVSGGVTRADGRRESRTSRSDRKRNARARADSVQDDQTGREPVGDGFPVGSPQRPVQSQERPEDGDMDHDPGET